MNAGRLQDIWRNLEPRGQIGLVGAALAVLATMFLLFTYASKPSYVTLSSGLSPADTGTMTKALSAAGISYRLGGGGTSIEVEKSQSSEARVALDEKNLLGDRHPGMEITEGGKLGATDREQKTLLLRGKEGELANHIEEFQGVTAAEVSLVQPDQTLFADEGSKATAGVLLTTSGVDEQTVRSIANLVAASAEGVDSQHVTIADSNGRLLWPNDSTNAGTSASTKLAAEEAYDSQQDAKINAFLATTLGPDKAQVRVHAELNADQTVIDKVTYAPKGTPLATKTTDETLKNKGGGATAGAASGAASNIPSYAAGAAGAGGSGSNSNYSNKTDSTEYGVNTTKEHTIAAPGDVQRLSVALLVDKSVPAKELADLKQTVGSMAGIDPTRGDTVAVSAITFAKPPKVVAAPAKASPLANPLGLAKYVGLGIGVLLFLFLMRRGLKRREGEDLGVKPTWLREIEGAVPLSELEAAGSARALERGGNDAKAKQQAELEEIVQAQPQRVAAQVGQWMQD